MMKRLVFIVEGDTEILLVEKIIAPYLHSKGYHNPLNCQTIITNRKQHKKGGVVSYGSFKNEVVRTLAQGNVIVTTLIDFFKLPTDFPAYTTNSRLLSQIEQAIWTDLNQNEYFIPYIKRHEVESLMFSDRSGFELVTNSQDEMNQIDEIIKAYINPEDINNSPQTAPSKRLEKIFKYDKVSDGELIFEMVGIDSMMFKCPRFNDWIFRIMNLLDKINDQES